MTEMNENMKKFPFLLESCKRTDRVQGFKLLSSYICSDESIPDGFIKKISFLLIGLIPVYNDRQSQHHLLCAIKELSEKFGESFKVIVVFYAIKAASSSSALCSTPALGRYYNFPLKVGSCIWISLTKAGIVFDDKQANIMVEAMSTYFSLAIQSTIPKLESRLMDSLVAVWKDPQSLEIFCKCCLSELSIHKLVLGGWLLKNISERNEPVKTTELKNVLIQFYVKEVLQSKKKPHCFILKKTSTLLKQITPEEFSDHILPAAQKALLRNPEVILEAVGYLLSNVEFDLSQYIQDFLKVLQSPLHASEDEIRDNAVVVCEKLAMKCSDYAAIKSFVKMLFSVLLGSDGKLTLNCFKISLLQAIENVSKHNVTKSQRYSLSEDVCERILKFLETETHEASLLQAISALSQWAREFDTQFPDCFVNFISKVMTLKSTTTNTRAAFSRCFSQCINEATAPKLVQIIPQVVKLLDKALLQPSQVQILCEALAWSTLLLNISIHSSEGKKICENSNSALDLRKKYFTSDRFLNQASGESLLELISWCSIILGESQSCLGQEDVQLYQALGWCLAMSDHKVRLAAEVAVRKLCSTPKNRPLISQLAGSLCNLLGLIKSCEKDDLAADTGGGTVSANGVLQGLKVLVSIKGMTYAQREDLAFISIKLIHHPATVAANRDMWPLVCKLLDIKPRKLFQNRASLIQKFIKDDLTISATSKEYLCGLLKRGGSILLPNLVSVISSSLDEPSLLSITDEEIDIYNTPEDVVYDHKVIDEAFENELNLKNVKRTTKTYSHKEEMIMLAEKRKDLEQKRKEGKLDLTPKQKELMKNQLEKEAVIRNRVCDLDKKASMGIFLLEAAINGNAKQIAPYLKKLVPLLIKYIPSKLVGERLAWIFYDMRKCVFNEEQTFGKMYGCTTLRACNAHMEFPNDWLGEQVDEAALRILKDLYSSTIETSESEETYLKASGFVYCFPLLEWLMTKCPVPADISAKNQAIFWGLNVIKNHMTMRGISSHCPYHPKFLPREELMTLLITIICTQDGRMQQMACAVLQDVCLCASGRPGCDKASSTELSILLEALTAPAQSVRDASLRGLNVLIESLQNLSLNANSFDMITHRLWVARHDEEEAIKELADQLWVAAGMKVTKNLLSCTINDISHPTSAVRSSASIALASLAKGNSKSLDSVVKQLIDIYKQQLILTPAKENQYGRIIEDAIDHWEGRSGVGLALNQIAAHLDEKNIISLTKFFIPDALGDRNETVRNDMLDAAMALVNLHGKKTIGKLLPVFEKFLNTAPKNAKFDAVRQSVVVLMGSLAKHLDPTDPKIKPIVNKLVDSLSTPSQQVQEAVANCLYPLVPSVKADCPKLVTKLMNILLESNNYGQRKGAAYGLAAVVKGLGILSLKQLNIMNQLTTSIQDKKVHRYREGALFAIEQLCNLLGKLFEPYIVYILPYLLLCFGDGNVYVRQAADDTAKAVMSKLSAHGVKLVLPSLLAALDEDSWRTKSGSIELLGNMAFCAPKQLSSCLPSIVPHLIEVLSDSHQKVQSAGGEALKLIGSVIRNPEIQAIVPVLLDALQDPSKNTSACLQTLLETKFIHFIDAPSLALIMPVVERSFQDRSTEVRKMSAQIIGNMYSLTDQKDLAPYLPSIIPGLKTSLLDPVPKVRTVSARALGAMVRGMGESSFDDLLPWLMQTLTSEASPVDRSGAAQGLAEVVGGLGPEKLHRLMPDIVATAERQDIAPHVKDGYIMMFIFLPTVFEEEFTQYIGQIIPSILKALADENEYVRDTALRAGQRIVNTYAESAVTLLLPELQNGLFHENWRIRYSSVQLLGDLLYRVSGVSGKMTTDTAHEDDNFGTEHSQEAIMRVLGVERRNRVLAGLYMGRSDLALMVRQAALHVWKVVVTNTPKTLREILSTLFSLLLGCLASTSYDKRQVAARTLGDLVRKLGERVLPEIIPILESGLESEFADHRQGVCIGLSEIMASTSRDMVLCFTDNLVPTVRRALCDPLPQVREAAAHTFESLHNTVGSRALDDILKPMLVMVQESSEKSEYALDGLKQVMILRSRIVLPYLIPQLTAPPVNTEALCILASVAGEALTKHLPKILPALIDAIKTSIGEDGSQEKAIAHCQEVILAVNDNAGINIIVDELLQHSKDIDVETSRAAVYLLLAFCSNTRADYTDYAAQLIRGLIHLFTSSDKVILQTAWNTLSAVTKSLDPTDQRALVQDVRQAVKFAASDLKGQELIPGFCLPKGIQPILPIFREAVLNGEPEQKEAASNGLTEVIRLTSSESLKISVIHMTGPLIRILGDRFTWNVKIAVLDTLALLLEKAGPMLKPFLPQLQTTFVKAVHDSHRGVRLKAGYALSHLMTIHTRPDPLFTELHNSVKGVDDPLFRETMLQAVRSVVGPAGFRMSEGVLKGLLSTLKSLVFNNTESVRLCAAGALGVLLRWLSEDDAEILVYQFMLDDNNSDATVRHGKSCAMFCGLKSAPSQVLKICSEERICKSLLATLSSDQNSIVGNAVVGAGFFMLHQQLIGATVPSSLTYAFAKTVNHPSNEVKEAMCHSCQYLAEQLNVKESDSIVSKDISSVVVPHLVNATKEKNPIVRHAAELALFAILKMQNSSPPNQEVINDLSRGTKEALLDIINKNLKKVVCIPVKESEIDPSLLT